MGIVLGIVADIALASIAAAEEAAAAAAAAAAGAEAAAAGAEAVVASEVAAEAVTDTIAEATGAAAGDTTVDAAADAGLEAGVETAGEVFSPVAKLCKIIKEFSVIDAVFKVAKEIFESLSDPESHDKMNRLGHSLRVLTKLISKLEELGRWLEDHKEDKVKLDGIDVPLESGILSTSLKPLFVVSY